MVVHLFLFLIAIAGGAESAPIRIVSLSPAVTENLFALGLGPKIVGTTDFSDEPAAAQKIPRIGDYFKPNIEKIISLKPTIVVGFQEGEDRVSAPLKKAKIPLLVLKTKSLDDYSVAMNELGRTFHREAQAQQLDQLWTQLWNEVPKLKKAKRALVQLEVEPVIVVGQNTFWNEILERCGLRNAIVDLDGYPQLSREALEKKDLDVIIFAGHLDAKMPWSRVESNIKTKKLSQVALIDGTESALGRLTPRLPVAARELCTQVQEKLEGSRR